MWQAWRWYNDNIGKGRCAIVDTYWQTETGGIMLTPLPGATPTKPGACMQPFFGIKVSLRNSLDHTLIEGAGEGVIVCESTWPSLGRTVYNNHQRYLKTYMSEVPGTYFFGSSFTDANHKDAKDKADPINDCKSELKIMITVERRM